MLVEIVQVGVKIIKFKSAYNMIELLKKTLIEFSHKIAYATKVIFNIYKSKIGQNSTCIIVLSIYKL